MMGYKRGEIVMKCEPFVFAVDEEYGIDLACDFCLISINKLNLEKLQECSMCKMVYYCSNSCRENAWKNHHENECILMQNTIFEGDVPENLILNNHILRLMTRIILKLTKNDQKFVELPNGKKRYFSDLISHKEDIINYPDPYWKKILFDQIYTGLQIWFGKHLPPKNDLLEIYGKCSINSLAIRPTGYGLFLDASAIDHSCIRNAVYVFNGKEVIVKSIENVSDFKDIRVSYLSNISITLSNTETRRNYLMECYHFKCECPRCLDFQLDQFNSSLICSKCCQGCIPSVLGTCTECNEQVDSKILEKHAKMKLRINHLLSIQCDKKTLNNLFEECEKIFHPFDEDFSKLIYELLFGNNAGDNEDNFEFILKLQKLFLRCCEKKCSNYDKQIGVIHLMIGELCDVLNLFSEAESHLKKAEDILSMSCGNDHPELSRCRKIRENVFTQKLLKSLYELKKKKDDGKISKEDFKDALKGLSANCQILAK